MPRPKIEVDLSAMQAILDAETASFDGKIIQYYDHCANIYNDKLLPSKRLYGQIIYTRVKSGDLTCTLKSGGRGQRTLSANHKEKLAMGRGVRKKRIVPDGVADALHKEFPSKTKLINKVLQGSLSAAVKAKCLDCCCEDKESIRLCTSKSCPLFMFRPYRKEVSVS